MTRLELLKLIVARARANGFDLRRWYTSRLGLPWISADAAVTLLDGQRRYYALLFSHEFAQTFWKPGSDITIQVPSTTFQRPLPDGTLRTVERKGYIRRSLRPDVWRYHLQGMALADEPLRYLRKYMHIEEALDSEAEPPAETKPADASTNRKGRKLPAKTAGKLDPGAPSSAHKEPRALPTGKPAFLKRPYKGILLP